MSALEQFAFAIVGVAILAASVALSDPHFGIAGAFRSDAAGNQYMLQSCSSR